MLNSLLTFFADFDRKVVFQRLQDQLKTWPGRLTLLAAVLLMLWLLVWLSRPTAVQVSTVVLAYPAQTISVLNASGYVVAQRKAAVSTRARGRLEYLAVAEGSVVKKGDLIARIENAELKAQLAQIEAMVGQAQVERDDAEREALRARDLLAKNFISKAAHDTAQARLLRANAQVKAAEANALVAKAALGQSEIRAPFDGVVLTKSANVGDNITPFSSAIDSKGAVVTLADMSSLEVEADVSESSLVKIRIGQPVEIALDAIPQARFPGKVARMVPTIDRAKATRLIKVQFDQIDPRVLPDMAAKVVFLERPLAANEREPFSAVSRRALRANGSDQGYSLFVIQDDRVKAFQLPQSAVPENARDETLVAVPDLKPGDRVVLSPGNGLRDGQRVSLVKP